MEEWRILVGNETYWMHHFEQTFKNETEATEYYDRNKRLGYSVRLQLRLGSNDKFETLQ
jgi:hypothetical protein